MRTCKEEYKDNEVYFWYLNANADACTDNQSCYMPLAKYYCYSQTRQCDELRFVVLVIQHTSYTVHVVHFTFAKCLLQVSMYYLAVVHGKAEI